MNSPIHARKHRGFARHLACLLFCAGFAGQARAFDSGAVESSVPRVLLSVPKGYESGSGFIVHSEDDYCIVATNFHVIADYTDATPLFVLRKVNGGIEAHKAQVIMKDNERDLALLKVPGMKAAALTLSTVEPKQGEDAYSIGYPGVADVKENRMALYKLLEGGHDGVFPAPDEDATTYVEPSVSKGSVRRMVDAHWKHLSTKLQIRIIQHDVNIAHGNSGGPLFNAAGQVIGVNTAIATAGSNVLDVDKFSESSHISVLIDVLKKQNISFTATDVAPVLATGAAPVAVVGSGGGEGGTSTWPLIVVTGLAVFALVVAMRKRQALVESYSHFVRRTGGKAERVRQETGGSSVLTTPPDRGHLQRPAAAAGGEYVIEGKDPDDRTPIRLTVDDALWRKAGDRIVVGRNGKQAHLCIHNRSVSGQHLSLLRTDSKFMVEDRGSSNGTSINGKKLVPYAPMTIEDGDLLQVGDVTLKFRRV